MPLDGELIARVVEAAKQGREDRVLLVLPTHRLQALARETILSAEGLSGVRRLGVLSFYQFTQRILTAAGLSREPVDDALRRFILGHLLVREAEAGRLRRFAPLAGSSGLAAALSRLTGELKLAGAAPEDLEGTVEAELVHVYRTYQEFLAARHLADREELQLLAREALRSRPGLLTGFTLLCDGFFDLTPIQAAILKEAARQVEALEFRLPAADPREELEAVVARVEGLLAPEVAVRRTPSAAAGPGRDPALTHLAEGLFQPSPAPADPGGAVRLTAAASPEVEVRRVAKEIKRLAGAEGVAPAEIAVLMPDASGYAGLVAAVFAEEGIPAAQPVEEALDRNPLVRTILLCLEAAAGLHRGFDLLKLVRSGYLGSDEGQLSLLRRVFRERGYLFTREEWERRLRAAEGRWARRMELLSGEGASGDEDGGAAGEARRQLSGLRQAQAKVGAVLEALAALPERASLAGHLAALEELLARLGLPEAALAPGVPETLRVRDWTALATFREVLATLARAGELVPETGEVPLGGFLTLLQAALTEARYPVGAALPGGVAALTVTQSRGLEYPYVFFVGLTDGVVPRPAREDWLLSEAVRRDLLRRGIFLETAAALASREKFLFHLGATRATRRLYLSFPAADGTGAVQLGSAYLAEVQRLFTSELAGTESDSPAGAAAGASGLFPECPGQVSSLRELLLLAGAELGRGEASGPATAALGERLPGLLSHLTYAAAAEARRTRFAAEPDAWTGLLVSPAARESLAARRGPGARWSAGQLSDYQRCPFRYFLQREVVTPPVEEAAEDLTPLERGQLLHEALRRYYREGGEGALGRPPEERAAALRPLLEQLFAEAPARRLSPHPALWEGTRAKAEAQLLAVLARDAACFAATGLRPAYLEWAFGLGAGRDVDPASVGDPLVLETSAGPLTAVGKVDRVDVDGEGRFVVYDYKSRSSQSRSFPTWQDERDGVSLQLRLYLLAVGRLLLPEAEAAGAGYFFLADASGKEGLWHKERGKAVNSFHRKKSAGLLAADEWDEVLDGTAEVAADVVRRIRAGEFPATGRPGECDRCRFRGACRVDLRAGLEGEEEA